MRTIRKSVLRAFAAAALLPVYWSSRLVPRKPNQAVFGAWFGERFADNPRYLLEHIRATRPGYKAIWLTKSRELRDELRRSGYDAELTYSLAGFWASARSKWGFLCTGMEDLNRYAPPQNVINLWHGIPLKRIVRQAENYQAPGRVRRLLGVIAPYTLSELKCRVCVSSRWEVDVMQEAFGLEGSRILRTGLPRNDVIAEKREVKRRVVYLPTHRGEGVGDMRDLIAGLISTAAKARSLGYALEVKFHHYHREQVAELAPEISMVDESAADFDLYRYLGESAMLITDFSSVAFDFLRTGRPIVYAPIDMTGYVGSEARGEFNMKYEDFAAGPVCDSWDEVSSAIEELANDPEAYSERRHALSSVVHEFGLANASEAIIEVLGLDPL